MMTLEAEWKMVQEEALRAEPRDEALRATMILRAAGIMLLSRKTGRYVDILKLSAHDFCRLNPTYHVSEPAVAEYERICGEASHDGHSVGALCELILVIAALSESFEFLALAAFHYTALTKDMWGDAN